MRSSYARILGEPVGLSRSHHPEGGHPPVVAEIDELQMSDQVAPDGRRAQSPRGGDGVEAQRDGGVADGVIVELKARGRDATDASIRRSGAQTGSPR